MEDQIVGLAQKVPALVVALSGLGTLTALATVLAPFTPTQKDDEALAWAKAHPIASKVLALVLRFSLIQPKAPEAKKAE